MRYRVIVDISTVESLVVAADTPEDAVRKAVRDLTEQYNTTTFDLRARLVQPERMDYDEALCDAGLL